MKRVKGRQLIGRGREIQQCVASLGPGRVTTVLGPAGVGKTTLVEHVAAQTSLTIRGYARLADAHDRVSVIQILAKSMGIAGQAGRVDLAQQVGRSLGRMGTGLLILDNAEHLVDVVKTLVHQWCQVAPEISWLLTSQVRLYSEKEQVIDLGPLSLPVTQSLDSIRHSDAVTLLIERTREIRYLNDPLEDDELLVMGRIATALDGLPLAIELAASRMRVLSPNETLEHLEERFRLLRSRIKSKVDSRHTTLETALEWSYSQLSVLLQSVLAQCSVFAGGFEYKAAESIIEMDADGDGPDLLDMLESLLDHSMLQRAEHDGVTRFRLLSSIREFMSAKLTESAPVLERHGAYYGHQSLLAARATRLKAGPQRRWLIRNELNIQHVVDTLETHGQVRAALSALLALNEILYTTPLDVHLVRLQKTLLHPQATADFEIWALACIAEARALRFLGRAAAGIGRLQEVILMAEEQALTEIQARALCDLARAYRSVGKPSEAERTLLQAQRLSKQRNMAEWYHSAAGTLALTAFASGRLDEARTLLLECNEFNVNSGRDQGERVSVVNLGRCHVELGELDEAQRCFSRSVALGEIINHEWSMGYGHMKLGELASVRGQTNKAMVSFDLALEMLRRSGDRPHEAEALCAKANCLVVAGAMTDALNLYQQALSLATNYQVIRVQVEARLGMALAHSLQTALTTARDLAQIAVGDASTMSDPTLNVSAQCILAVTHALATDPGGARKVMDAAREQAKVAMPRSRVCVALVDSLLTLIADNTAQVAEDLSTLRRGTGTTPGSGSWFETQMIERLIRRKLPVEAAAQTLAVDADLRVSANGFSIRDGVWNDLSKKDLLRRFLGILVEAHVQQPGEALVLEHLIEVLWPGERMYRDAGATRIYTVVAHLRRMGLRGILLRRSGGYLLDEDIKIVRIDR